MKKLEGNINASLMMSGYSMLKKMMVFSNINEIKLNLEYLKKLKIRHLVDSMHNETMKHMCVIVS